MKKTFQTSLLEVVIFCNYIFIEYGYDRKLYIFNWFFSSIKFAGMNGVQKFQIHRDERSTSRLPCAHTCFNQLDLPVYETYEKLRTQLLLAINESSEGFGLA